MNNKTAAYKYLNEYQKKNYDRITILRKPGEKNKLTKIAKERGYKTVTQFINACIDEKINSFAEPPVQAPLSPVEAAEPTKPKYLPLTPENIQKVDFALLKTDMHYQLDIMDAFGSDGLQKLVDLAKQKN